MLLILTLLWAGYFSSHSWLATIAVKATVRVRFPQIYPYYRLIYNIFSIVLILPILIIIWRYPGNLLWQWQGIGQWLMNIIALAALTGFAYSMRFYDGKTFLGLRPNSENRISAADEPFTLSPLHRYVRHPWYSFSLVLIWSRDMSAAWLVSCIMISLYLVIGSRLEERKLIQEYGDSYRQYLTHVPGLIPLPGQSLSATEAAAITHPESQEHG